LKQVRTAIKRKKPFFISVTPVMPHWGSCYGPAIPDSAYSIQDPHWEFHLTDPLTGKKHPMPISPCPTDRNKQAFAGKRNPHIAEVWNVTITGPRPEFMQTRVEAPGLFTAFVEEREDIGWRNRSAALMDLDDMIGEIMVGLEQLDVLNDTFVVFTSDNGYHLGEHKMPMGKGEPYDTDTTLPMYLRGPGVASGATLSHPTNHLDITATIVELAGAAVTPAGVALDGKSFAAEIANASIRADPDGWRQYSFSEFFSGINTWQLVRVVNSTHKFSYIRWCTKDSAGREQVEIFDMLADPWQSHNLLGKPGLGTAAADRFDGVAAALGTCAGEDCAAQLALLDATSREGTSAVPPLTCYQTIQAPGTSGSFQLGSSSKGGPIDSMSGWAVDFAIPPSKGQPRGWTAATVRVLLDGVPQRDHNGHYIVPDQLANHSRPDLVPKAAPNADHGFNLIFPLKFLPATGKHSVTLRMVSKGAPGQPPKGGGIVIGKTELKKCFRDLRPCDC
jgi:hypothetical protein